MAESISAKTAWALAKAIKGGSKKKLPNSGSATIVRVDQDGTHWVRISGSDVETPINGSITADARPGDVVQYHLEDTRISITGNATSPSVGKEYVDERVEPLEAKVDVVARANALLNTATERARSVADAASAVANAVNQHFFSDTSGIHVTEATQADWNTNHSGANVLINSIGQLFRDGLNNLLTLTTENGARALTVWDGLGNTASHIRAIIGEVITLGPVGSVQMVLSSAGLEIDNESGDGIFAIDSGSTGSVTIALDATLVTWNATTDVATTAYTVSDSGAAAGDVAVTATVDGTDYALDSTYATATVTAGTGVSVALTSAGVTYVRGLMVETVEDDGSTVTTTYPCELSVEYQHAVTDVALLSLIGSQTIDGEGESLRITNSKWVANSRQSSTLVRLHNAITGRGVKLGVSSNGYTRGLWDSYKGDWVIARNKDNKTVINGPNFSVSSGGTVNASGTIASWYQVSAKGNGSTSATRRVVALRSNSAGNRGLYDVSLDKWMLYKRPDGTLVLNDPLYIREDTCTVNTSNASIAGNVNYCWHNGAVCTITITVNLKASLATNSTVTVATAPSSYRPAHDVMGQVYITGQNPAELQARLTDAGAINLNNRSGSAVSTSANIYISFTFAL